MISQLLHFWRRWRLLQSGVKLGPNPRIAPGVEVRVGRGEVCLGADCQLERGVVLHSYDGNIHCGDNVFLGPYVIIYGHGGVSIGDHTLIAAHCVIVSSNHNVPGRHELIRFQPDIKKSVSIGRDVWLGAGVRILAGVVIGEGAVIGAGAVVTRDIPAYSIAYGVPARVVGQRK